MLGGAALGIVSAYLFTEPFKENLEVAAFSSGDTVGLRWRYRW